MKTASLPIVLALLFTSTVQAQRSWFPEQLRQGASRALSERLKEADLVPKDQTEAQVLEGALNFVDTTLDRIETLGAKGLAAGAPTFDRFELPTFDSAIVQLLASYSVCTLPLHLELAQDDNERFYVAFGEIAVVAVSAFLRDAYLLAGGTDVQLKEALDSEVMRKLSYDVQVDAELRNHAAERCADPMGKILN